ncbi:ABC-three component system middle component 1 [Bacillus paranthracis]|uniref:ABC-three component system middle component 1 n=1 Tax=Bacillus paranthracis TaxID=2026186 RepID=UPI003F6AB22B
MNFKLLINRLLEKGFQEEQIEGLPRNGFFFRKEIINVLVIHCISSPNINKINEEVLAVREYLASLEHINIWNTYGLVVIESEIDYETIHVLEKDSSSIRKFVLQSEEDFGRVFFLDSEETNDFTPISISKTKSEENLILRELYKFIKDKGGETKKLKTKDVKEGIETLINLVGE